MDLMCSRLQDDWIRRELKIYGKKALIERIHFTDKVILAHILSMYSEK